MILFKTFKYPQNLYFKIKRIFSLQPALVPDLIGVNLKVGPLLNIRILSAHIASAFMRHLKKVVDNMPGQVNLVWRHFPLPFHEPLASKEAGASICAYQQGGSAGYWKYTDAIFKLTKGNNQGIPAAKGIDPLLKLATEQGLNIDQFKLCMANDADLKKQIATDIKNDQAAGISGTPGVIIINKANGKVNIVAGTLLLKPLKML